MTDRKHLERLTKSLVDEGKLIEAGWVSMRIACGLIDTPAEDLRIAFFAGAQHLFGSMLSFLEEGEGVTEKDMDRLSLIHNELQTFLAEFEARVIRGGRTDA